VPNRATEGGAVALRLACNEMEVQPRWRCSEGGVDPPES